MKDVVFGQQYGLIRQQELEQVDERCAQSREHTLRKRLDSTACWPGGSCRLLSGSISEFRQSQFRVCVLTMCSSVRNLRSSMPLHCVMYCPNSQEVNADSKYDLKIANEFVNMLLNKVGYKNYKLAFSRFPVCMPRRLQVQYIAQCSAFCCSFL